MTIDSVTKIVEYFKKNMAKGYTIESLQIALIKQGYSRAILQRAIEKVHKDLSQKAPVLKEKPKIKYQIIDQYNQPVEIKKSLFKRIFRI